MRMRILFAVTIVALAACATAALAAEPPKKDEPCTVVYKDASPPAELRNLEVGYDDEGLLGTTYKKLKKLPVKVDKLRLDVPLEKLAKIEVLSADKDGKVVKLRLTCIDGKTIEGTIDSDKKLIWKAVHPFADSEAIINLPDVKEIVLKPEKK